ncbi:MAG: hypothetical protein HWN68_21170 [Desulfobacterales bacterium]|nr:hypothetical protein [Desulfobacterales bacterium]
MAEPLIAVRGIILDYMAGTPRYRVITRLDNGWEYHNDTIPPPYSITKAEIKKFIKDTYHIPVGKIGWCEWVKIPQL